jgi:hypothetical protein
MRAGENPWYPPARPSEKMFIVIISLLWTQITAETAYRTLTGMPIMP